MREKREDEGRAVVCLKRGKREEDEGRADVLLKKGRPGEDEGRAGLCLKRGRGEESQAGRVKKRPGGRREPAGREEPQQGEESQEFEDRLTRNLRIPREEGRRESRPLREESQARRKNRSQARSFNLIYPRESEHSARRLKRRPGQEVEETARRERNPREKRARPAG